MIEPSLPEAAAGSYHSDQVAVDVRLNTNESPVSPPPAFMARLGERLAGVSLNRYPDRNAIDIRTAIAVKEGRHPEEIFVANGSNEVLQTIFLAYGGPDRSVYLAQPTYGMYTQIAKSTRTTIVDGKRGEDWRLDRFDIDPSAEIVVICDPNNPTGLAEVGGLASLAPERPDSLFVIDRAYADFADGLEAWLGSNVVEVKTFSKAFGMAGLRLGYAVADPEMIKVLYSTVLPYHLDSLKQQAALVALEMADELFSVVGEIRRERDLLIEELRSLPVRCWQSSTNFVLFAPDHREARAVWSALVERSILIRDSSTWPGLDNTLRVTVGTPGENARFIEALREVLAN